MSAARTARTFFDSNVLVYADDAGEPGKKKIAQELIREHFSLGSAVVSVQVMQEYFNAVTKKLRIDPAVARAKVELMSRFVENQTLPEDVLAAIDLHRLHQISIWDAMIVRMAQQSSARILYTEDLQHGRRFDSMEIVNPFL